MIYDMLTLAMHALPFVAYGDDSDQSIEFVWSYNTERYRFHVELIAKVPA